ncbi:hypothetical protein LTR39_003069, partial [Cryomyces antarcticus]
NPLPHRYMFPQMYHVQDLIRKARPKRRTVHAELRGSIYGCEHDYSEALGANADDAD